MLAELKRMTNK